MTPFLELKNVSKVFSSGVFNKKQTVALDKLSMSISIYQLIGTIATMLVVGVKTVA